MIRVLFAALIIASGVLNARFPDTIKAKYLVRFDGVAENIRPLVEEAARQLSPFQKTYAYLVTDDTSLEAAGFTRVNSIDEIDPKTVPDAKFIVFFYTDDDYAYNLKKIKDLGGIFYTLPHFCKTRYVWVDKHAAYAIDNSFSTFRHRTTHHDLGVHEQLCQTLNMTKDLPGDYVEIGVYRGDSALTALDYMRRAQITRNSYFLDTFNGMTYEEAYDSPDVSWRGTHVLDGVDLAMQHVENLLKTTGKPFQLVRSNICRDALPEQIQKIAVCNLDVDLYDATLSGLQKVAPLIVKRGIIICEDPPSTPGLGGALIAMEEFLSSPEGKKFVKICLGPQYLLIKVDE